MSTIILHCTYTGAPGAARGFVEEMLSSGLRQAVLGEDGCLQYDYFYSAQEAASAVLLEKWRDAAALQKHIDGEPMRALKVVKAGYDLETKIEKFEVND